MILYVDHLAKCFHIQRDIKIHITVQYGFRHIIGGRIIRIDCRRFKIFKIDLCNYCHQNPGILLNLGSSLHWSVRQNCTIRERRNTTIGFVKLDKLPGKLKHEFPDPHCFASGCPTGNKGVKYYDRLYV
jgi:hypothetical protein